MPTSQNPEKTCPLCGADNQCAVAAGRPAESCWCQDVTLDPRALEKIPEESVGKHCICPSCGKPTPESVQ